MKVYKGSHEFIIKKCGDPFNRTGWDIIEVVEIGDTNPSVSKAVFHFQKVSHIFRGDLSPIQGLANTKSKLRKLYPDCIIHVEPR